MRKSDIASIWRIFWASLSTRPQVFHSTKKAVDTWIPSLSMVLRGDELPPVDGPIAHPVPSPSNWLEVYPQTLRMTRLMAIDCMNMGRARWFFMPIVEDEVFGLYMLATDPATVRQCWPFVLARRRELKHEV